ncbi:MAG TPA: PRC-barrel domain-containing protein [Candidatus Limnocylindrales bacterium]
MRARDAADGRPDEAIRAERPAAEATRSEQERAPGTVLSIEDLVGARVVTADGTPRGTVVDVLASPPPRMRLEGLVVGKWGWLQRLRVAARLRGSTERATRFEQIDWLAVDHWDGLRIVLRGEERVHEVAVRPAPTGATEPGKPLEPQQDEEPLR